MVVLGFFSAIRHEFLITNFSLEQYFWAEPLALQLSVNSAYTSV